jgi:hypothetical protein
LATKKYLKPIRFGGGGADELILYFASRASTFLDFLIDHFRCVNPSLVVFRDNHSDCDESSVTSNVSVKATKMFQNYQNVSKSPKIDPFLKFIYL